MDTGGGGHGGQDTSTSVTLLVFDVLEPLGKVGAPGEDWDGN